MSVYSNYPLLHHHKMYLQTSVFMFTYVHCSYYSGRPAFGCYDKLKNTCDYITFGEVYDQVRNFAAGLKKLLAGHPSPMVSMCSVTRPEWYITDYACLLLGIPTVSLHLLYDVYKGTLD